MRVHINIVAHFKTSSLTWFIKGFMKDVYKQKQSSYKLDYLSRKIINLKVGNFRRGVGGRPLILIWMIMRQHNLVRLNRSTQGSAGLKADE